MMKNLLRSIAAFTVLTLSPAAFSADCEGVDGSCDVGAHTASEPVLNSELEAAVLKIIADHPQLLVDTLNSYSRQQAQAHEAQLRKNMADSQELLLHDPMDLVIGNPNGDVTLVEFYDNQCPWCHKFEPTLDALIKADPNLRVVLKELMLSQPGQRSPWLGAGSLAAAKVAIAAKKQGDARYAALHHELMNDDTPEGHLELGHIIDLAAKAGLDTNKLAHDMAAPEVEARIYAIQDLALKIGVDSTPGIVLGTQILSKTRDFAALQKAIQAARSQITAVR